jgi:hypothetical protein
MAGQVNMDRLIVSAILPSDEEVEVVERKGLGHPDTVCDALVEYSRVRSVMNTGIALARFCITTSRRPCCGAGARFQSLAAEKLKPDQRLVGGPRNI